MHPVTPLTTRLAATRHCNSRGWLRIAAATPMFSRLGVHRAAKRFVADPDVLVDSALRACISLQPGLAMDKASRVVYRRQNRNSRVTLLSGGGSGHEPGHAGYVAEGLLDAAVSGPIFASPSAKHVRVGLRHIASPKGSLVIIKNYTGDRLNFGLAVEQSRAYDGQAIETVVIQDDVAVPRSRCGRVGRRGLAGVALVHKVAGASAAEGTSLAEVASNARSVSDHLATIGVSLDACSVPGAQEGRTVAPGEMELGMGIHNEPGTQTISSNQSTTALIRTMLSAILDLSDKERGFLKWNADTQFVLLVNNLGGLSKLELLSLTQHVLDGMKADFGIIPCRVYSGTYLSSLDGAGFSITLLALTEPNNTAETLRLLDTPTTCINWPPALSVEDVPGIERADSPLKAARNNGATTLNHTPIAYDAALFRTIIERVHTSLVQEEPEITRFDTHLGDGDCGTTLLSGTSGLQQAFPADSIEHASDLVADMQLLTDTLGTAMGGTSGALYSIFFSGFVGSLQEQCQAKPGQPLSLPHFSEALMQGLATMKKYTAADVGDRTMMDALIPFVEELHARRSGELITAFSGAVDAARGGRDSTSLQQSRYGRSTYVGAAQAQGSGGVEPMPDPGACGVVAIVHGVLDAIKARR